MPRWSLRPQLGVGYLSVLIDYQVADAEEVLCMKKLMIGGTAAVNKL